MNTNSKLQGYYQISKGKGDKTTYKSGFHNLITNNGLENIGNNSADLRYFALGRGTSPSSVTMTSMEDFIVGSSSVATEKRFPTPIFWDNNVIFWDNQEILWEYGLQVSIPPYYVGREFMYRFPVGSLDGEFTEIGVGGLDTAENGSNVFSRALIRDLNGDPTTITILADEWLDVHYFLTEYLPEDVSGSFMLNGQLHLYTARPAELSSSGIWNPVNQPDATFANAYFYSDYIRTVSEMPLGSYDQASIIHNPYVAGSYERSARIVAGVDEANWDGGIGAVMFRTNMHSSYQIGFDPPIPKTDVQSLEVTVKHSWARRTV